jgi:hypothetical protein
VLADRDRSKSWRLIGYQCIVRFTPLLNAEKVRQPIIIWIGNTGSVTVYVDNVVLTVPEPTGAVLLCGKRWHGDGVLTTLGQSREPRWRRWHAWGWLGGGKASVYRGP